MRRRSGQVAVEAAIVLPVWIFLALTIVQLAVVQHARLLTEYAAYSAARAGIVWNGNNERMRDAALFAVLPSFGPTGTPAALAATHARASRRDALLHQLFAPLSDAPMAMARSGVLGLVRVDPITLGALPAGWNAGPWWEELDFDAADTLPDSDDSAALRRATSLTVRVRHWYELRIPFAGGLLFLGWYAANSAVALRGALDAPGVEPATIVQRAGGRPDLRGAARGIHHRRGLATATPHEMDILWDLASGALALDGPAPRYLLPITGVATLRMQSAVQRKWVFHPEVSR